MSYIRKDKVEEIKENSDIVSVISEYVQIKQNGKYFVCNCPFHHEKTPSFFIYPETNTFHCFGCGKHGDSISFIMEMDSVNYVEALTKLSDKFNIPLEYETNYDFKPDFQKYYELNDFTAKFYYRNMLENTVPKQYLFKRGITQKTINIFMLGYANENWKSLFNEINKRQYDIKIAEEIGLIIKTKSGDYIDRFRNRIIFPILNKDKKIIGFGGRTLANDNAKYLNSPESVIFKKGDNLYSIDKFKEKNIRDRLIIVEGYMDVISLYQSGIDYAVAGLGTAFTENQAKLAYKFAKKDIYLCFDSDNAGRRATIKANEIFNRINVKPNIISLPEGLDPDDFVKKNGLDDFEELLSNSIDINMFNYNSLKSLKKDSNSITDNSIFYEQILDFLCTIKSDVLRDNFIIKITREFGLNETSLKNDFVKYSSSVDKSTKEITNDDIINNTINTFVSKNDKKVVIMGIILLMKGNKNVLPLIDEIRALSENISVIRVLNYVYNNLVNNNLTSPSMLIEEFKKDEDLLSVVDYINKQYSKKISITYHEFEKIFNLSLVRFKIRTVTNNIDKLQKMDKNNDNVSILLNNNILELMDLNKKLKSLEKGVHHGE